MADMTSIKTFSFVHEKKEGDDRPPLKKVKMVIKVRRNKKFYE